MIKHWNLQKNKVLNIEVVTCILSEDSPIINFSVVYKRNSDFIVMCDGCV